MAYNVRLAAVTTFGLEAPVKRELAALGFKDIKASDTRVDFFGDTSAIARANLWLRCADRVMLIVDEFKAETFTELFDGVYAVPWGDLLPLDAKFVLTGKSVKSKLFSVSDCQSIAKKAVAEKLKLRHGAQWFPETGAEHKIQIGIKNDIVTIAMDTTGPGLHKRGYRPEVVAAPIKETLAAALIQLSYWRKDRVLFDPFCGSGTIPIEAAMIAKNIAPGLTRRFSSENWELIGGENWKNAWARERQNARDAINRDIKTEIYGSDIDAKCVALSVSNSKRAGVGGNINFTRKDLFNAELPAEYGVSIMNPPYGERLATADEAAALYTRVGELFRGNKKWSAYVLTSDESFEKCFGKKADAKRKLFNGMIKTDYYQYFGDKPSALS